MFTENIYECETRQKELHRQAAHYRLVKSLRQRKSISDQLAAAIGKIMVRSGQGLVSYSQAAR